MTTWLAYKISFFFSTKYLVKMHWNILPGKCLEKKSCWAQRGTSNDLSLGSIFQLDFFQIVNLFLYQNTKTGKFYVQTYQPAMGVNMVPRGHGSYFKINLFLQQKPPIPTSEMHSSDDFTFRHVVHVLKSYPILHLLASLIIALYIYIIPI